MSLGSFFPFFLFIITMTITPGPGNLAFMAIASRSGYKATFPFIIASKVGFLLVNLSVAFGLGTFMTNNHAVITAFKFISLMYMTYLAWKIIHMSINYSKDNLQPKFLEYFFIHPLSPKSWAMSLVAFSTFLSTNTLSISMNAIVLSTSFFFFATLAHSIWAILGSYIIKIIGDGLKMRITTVILALSMIGITIWSLFLTH